MKWVLEHLQFIIAAAAAIAYYLNRRRGEGQDKPDEEAPRKVVNVETDEQAERTRKIQAEIRRKIAERRGKMADVPTPGTVRERIPPLVRPAQTPPIDPFGGPMRRIIRELEQAAEKRLEPVPDPTEAARAAALERQQRLAAEMRALEAERLAQQQRAQEIMAVRNKVVPISHAPIPMGSVRADLGNRRELRRAIVLREILGAPVALR